MTSLRLESLEIEGVRKVLLRLQGEYDFSITPSVKCKCKSFDGKDTYEYFPIPVNLRKKFGEGMIRCLLESKDNMRKFLYGGEILLKAVRHFDKKGKVTKVDIEIKEE